MRWSLQRSDGSPNRGGWTLPLIFGQSASQCSAAIKDNLTRRVKLYGVASSEVPAPGECLSSLLKCADTVAPDSVSTVRPFCLDKVRICKSDHERVLLTDLLDGEALNYAMHPELILRADDDVPDEKPQIYTDPILQDRSRMLELIRELVRRGFACGVLSRTSTVGVFTVEKKMDLLRLIFIAG